MMTIFGKPRARGGQIMFDGHDITEAATHQIARMRIAQSPEGRRIFPRMSVAENLQMGADATDSSEAERAAGLERVFTLFPRLKERVTQRGGTLSGGEQQMLAIARAMIAKPDLIMLDEPSEGIMPVLVDEMFELFRAMKAQGTTVLLVEQNVELALDIADRAYVLDQGTVVHQASAKELLADNDIKERYCSV
jgi:branched-chain amino acid transport system ATP-binding protein